MFLNFSFKNRTMTFFKLIFIHLRFDIRVLHPEIYNVNPLAVYVSGNKIKKSSKFNEKKKSKEEKKSFFC